MRCSGCSLLKAGGCSGACEKISTVYDQLFSLDEQQVEFFKKLTQQHDITTVLDVACGSGELAVLMASWGKRVTAINGEPRALNLIRRRGEELGVRLELLSGDIRDVSRLCRGRHDLVTCLRNVLPHLLKEEDIWGTLAQMYLVLEPGGVLVIHTLNFDRISNGDLRVSSPVLLEGTGDFKAAVSFEQGSGGCWQMILETGDRGLGEGKLIVPVKPIFRKQLNFWLAEMGFENIQNLGGYDWSPFGNGWYNVTVACRPLNPGN